MKLNKNSNAYKIGTVIGTGLAIVVGLAILSGIVALIVTFWEIILNGR